MSGRKETERERRDGRLRRREDRGEDQQGVWGGYGRWVKGKRKEKTRGSK